MEIPSTSRSLSPVPWNKHSLEDWDNIAEELPDSLAPYIKFASSKENSNKLVVNATLDSTLQRVLHGEAAAETFFGWTVQWLLLPHRQEVENFKTVLKVKYGKETANFAFPKRAEKEALSVGLQGGMIREAILKALYQKTLSKLLPIAQKYAENIEVYAHLFEGKKEAYQLMIDQGIADADFAALAAKEMASYTKGAHAESVALAQFSKDLEETILYWLALNGDAIPEPEPMDCRSAGLAALTLLVTTVDLTMSTQSSIAWFRRALWVARMLRG